MENTPEIRTSRLLLRRFTPEDAEAFYQIMSDKEVNTFLPWFPMQSLEEAAAFLQEKYLKSYEKPEGFRYAVCFLNENVPIGYVNVDEGKSHDLGYGLRKEYWHQGIVTEVCLSLISLLKEAGISYITATHDRNNPRSGKVMKKIGMTYRHSYEEQWQPKNIRVTFRMYQLNLDGQEGRVYQEYWDKYPNHFIEEI